MVFGIVFAMVGLSFASVPLYDLFCRVTGFGGTTQVATTLPDRILERSVRVQFNADTAPDLPWDFKPLQRSVDVHIGQQALVAYKSQNITDVPAGGTAVYNVTPQKVGKYFHKIQCFCFDEQILNPGQAVNMPVTFFIDPAMDDDPEMDNVEVITLSYSFFSAQSERLERALEAYYNDEGEEQTFEPEPRSRLRPGRSARPIGGAARREIKNGEGQNIITN